MKVQVMHLKDSEIVARAKHYERGRSGITRRRLNRMRSCSTLLITSSRCVLLFILFILSLNILTQILNTNSKDEEDNVNQDLSSMHKCKFIVIKAFTCQNVFLLLIDLVLTKKFKFENIKRG